ncbi:PTS sugar transporter subunit IIA [Thermoactinomyces mirandus]|uniref:PTS sugar transporter subunit IIA n=1 Tax=Thermoactinomyces mirandus TaxID=2756294 RepID=UPI001C68C1BF|nr:mannose/fructose/sorbose PTS transporter subunit IIA [Thermoactinomyces mirandus]
MIALVVATHGEFSKEIVKSAEMILGDQENVIAVTFKPGEGLDGLTEKYQKALKELDTDDGVLFLVDLFVGSPFNAAANLIAAEKHMDVVTGVNLPMLIECFDQRGRSDLETLVEAISRSAMEGVKSLKKTLQANKVEEEL